MKDSFKIGDVVRLSSGGPEMTVAEVMEKSTECWWHAKEKRGLGYSCSVEKCLFPTGMLKLVEERTLPTVIAGISTAHFTSGNVYFSGLMSEQRVREIVREELGKGPDNPAVVEG